jgi:hypothetical protein
MAEVRNGSHVGFGVQLVIAADHPHFAAMLNTHLRGAQQVTGRMQRHPHAVVIEWFAKTHSLRARIGSQAFAQNRRAGFRDEIRPASWARVIAVCMRDDRAIDRLPGIDIEPANRTMQAALGLFDQIRHESLCEITRILDLSRAMYTGRCFPLFFSLCVLRVACGFT